MRERKYEEIEIDGLKVKTVQLGFEKADQLWHDTLLLITPALGELNKIEDGGLEALAPALLALLKGLPGKEAALFKRRVLEGTVVLHDDGKGNGDKYLKANDAKNMELLFTGRLPAFYKILWFAFKTNFSDFFDGDTAPLAQLMKLGAELMEVSKSDTPTNADSTTEPGSSGSKD